MLISAFTVTAAATAKWLLAAKIATAVGTVMLPAAPYLDRKIEERLKAKKGGR